jgi:hypothetical protein
VQARLRGEGQKRKRDGTLSTSSSGFDHYDIFEGLKTRRTFDWPQFSMTVLADLIPDASRCRVVDIYTQRQSITDADGVRLGGKTPYSHDEQVPSHYAHCKSQVEDCKGDLVLLAGLDAKYWFEALWGKLRVQGQVVTISSRKVSLVTFGCLCDFADELPQRRVYFMDHMEYTARYASDDRLEALREVLRQMRASGINTCDTFINKRIASRAAKRLQALVAPKLPSSSANAKRPRLRAATNVLQPTAAPAVIDLDSDDDDVTPEDFEGHVRIRVDKEVTQSRSDSMKAVWQDPEMRSRLLAHRADPKSRAKLSAALKKNWADPEYAARISAALKKKWADPEYAAKMSTAAKKKWTNPEYAAKMSETTKQNWADPEFAAKMIAAGKRKLDDPEYKAKVSDTTKARMEDPTLRATISASVTQKWADPAYSAMMRNPERTAQRSATAKAFSQRPGFTDNKSDAMRFRRDDSVPKLKKAWDKKVDDAAEYVKGDENGSRNAFFHAFATLHLDPEDYNVDISQQKALPKTAKDLWGERAKAAFFKKAVQTGYPFFNNVETESLIQEINSAVGSERVGEKRYIDTIVKKQVVVWLRAAALMRKYGVDVDYANILHLKWMA